MLVNAEKKDSLSLADSPAPHDLERALAEAAEEMDFDWPEFLPGGADQSWNHGNRSWIPAGGRLRGLLQLPFVVSTLDS
jgi:hypothetical protein